MEECHSSQDVCKLTIMTTTCLQTSYDSAHVQYEIQVVGSRVWRVEGQGKHDNTDSSREQYFRSTPNRNKLFSVSTRGVFRLFRNNKIAVLLPSPPATDLIKKAPFNRSNPTSATGDKGSTSGPHP